jgi:gluconolactonase
VAFEPLPPDRWAGAPVRYPDPAVRVLDPRFAPYRLGNAAVERIATGFRWAEGVVWFGDLRCLLWSDIPNDRMLRWSEETGQVSVFRSPAHHANGHTRDRQGRLVSCEHGPRRVTRTEHDGRVTVLLDRFEGRRLNAPNDVVVKSDDSVWFTDPPFGIGGNYEGSPAEPELPQNVYRVDGASGELSVVASDVKGPNGLAFSPDEKILYVAQSFPARAVVMAYDVAADGLVKNGRVFFDMTPWVGKDRPGLPDGLKVDVAGNLFATGPGGVVVLSPKGEHLGTIATGVPTANCAFGGDGRTLYVTANNTLCRIRLATKGRGF